MSKEIDPINSRFKELRLHLKLSQVQLADAIAISQGNVTDIERGKIGVSKRVIKKLAAIFGVNEIWLHTGSGQMITDNLGILKGNNEGVMKGFEIFNPKPSVRKFYFTDLYKNLSDSELDTEISIEIDNLRISYMNYQKMTEYILYTYPDTSASNKFPLVQPFETYKQGIDEKFLEDHKDVTDTRELKALIIVDLYKAKAFEWDFQLTILIDYINKANRFFPAKQKGKKDNTNDQ